MQSVGPHTPSSVDFLSMDQAENQQTNSVGSLPAVVFVGELVIAEQSSMEALFPMDNPSLHHQDEMDIDEPEAIEGNEIQGDQVMRDGAFSDPKFLPKNPELNSQLKFERDALQLYSDPKPIFALVAENTNPKKIIFMLENILHIISELLTEGKFLAVLNRNCVHCTRAVDKTLASLCKEQGKPRLHQVIDSGEGKFSVITGARQDPIQVHPGQSVITLLKSNIPVGKRACISVPVLGMPNHHAMNYVRYTDKQFIICGQTGTVYDLSLETDCENFAAQYGVQGTGMHLLQIVITGNAPGAALPEVENHQADETVPIDRMV